MSSRQGIDDRSVNFETRVISRKWLSFHVYLSGSIDSFLSQYLASALEQECALRHIHRFFFIRYSDQDLHLRLRFLPRRTGEPAVIKEWIESTVRDFAGSLSTPGICRVEQRTYDRDEHYFGETIYSVYAELLNEQTSWFGLKLLRGYHDKRPQLTALLAACLAFFLSRMTEDREDYIQAVELARSFAGTVLKQLGFIGDLGRRVDQHDLDALIPQISSRSIPFLSQDPAAMSIIRLSRRARKAGDQGKFIVAHALHLLCNKLGFSIREEYWIFTLLRG